MCQKYLFSESELQSTREKIFNTTPLGKLKSVLPITELGGLLPTNKNPQGCRGWFDNAGKISLMFLKNYVGVSDASLIEQLNGNWHMQFFCGIQLKEDELIKDQTLISGIRSQLSEVLDLKIFQDKLLGHWKGEMQETHVCMQDATVYESYIKYPTDTTLLWDCCIFMDSFYEHICKELKLKKGKHSFKAQCKKQRIFNLLRKKSHKKKRRRRGQLLKLLQRLKHLIRSILDRFHKDLCIPQKTLSRYQTVQRVMGQQRFLQDNPGKSVPERIVSLYKPYVRPIVRGKETKPVEFGAKVHMMQVDGINIIEHYDYEPYNECKRLKSTIELHQEIFGTTHQVAGDRIYATNENRTYLKSKNIAHNFVPKGKGDTPEKKQLRDILNIGRSTVLEGSFGNEKNHYSLQKVKARTQRNEILWIFFGVMTANAVKMAKRKKAKDPHLQEAA